MHSGIKIKDLPAAERPRERLAAHGAEALSNAELLSIILGVGSRRENALMLASRLLAAHNISELAAAGVPELKSMFGINDAKASKIIACMELGRRAASGREERRAVKSPDDIASFLAPKMRHLRKEVLKCVLLDSKCGVMKCETIAAGGISASSVHAREIFGPAVAAAASAVVLVHNHPSGDPAPSKDDIALTRAAAKAGRLLGIELLDHIIIGRDSCVSFRETGMM